MRREILFLAHRLPFPPDRGDRIRSHHVLKHLAGLAPVHVGCLADDERDCAQAAELDGVAQSQYVAVRRKPLPLAGIEALVRREPVSLSAFRHTGLEAWVRHTLATRPISTVYVFSGQMGQYVPPGFKGRVVVDLVDVDSAKFEAYASQKSGPRSWIDAREGRLLARVEQRLAERAAHTLFVSEAEAGLFLSRLQDCAPVRVRALANGIDTDFFSPAAVPPDGQVMAKPGPHICFTGQMDYPPNVEAAIRLAERVMPGVRAAYPQAQCHIVGRDPAPAVRALDGCNGVRVWGSVPDVRPFLAAADLVVVPLVIARGVQNKVLEAMAMARPVVLSPEAATGIATDDGEPFSIARDDAKMIAQSLDLLGNLEKAKALGKRARGHVVEHCSWAGALAPLAGIMGIGEADGDGGMGRAAA